MHSDLEKEIEKEKANLKSKSKTKNEIQNSNFKKEIEFINQNQKAKELLTLLFNTKNKHIHPYETMLSRHYGTRILKTLLEYNLLVAKTWIGDDGREEEARTIEITGLGAWILSKQG